MCLSLRSAIAAGVAGGALLSACASQPDSAATERPPVAATSTEIARTEPTPPALPVAAPQDYRYVLTSSCGERGLLGDYDVVVLDGKVTSAESLNEDYPYRPDPSEVPTLVDLFAKAQSASSGAIVEFVLDEAGLPKSLSLDPVPNGTDDEECYEVSHLKEISSSTGQADRSADSDDGVQVVTVHSVVVSVPDTWVSTPNGCEAALGQGTYVHAPGELGSKTCGTVPSLTVVSADEELGRALTRYRLFTIEGVAL